MENITGKAVDGENYLQTRLYLVDDLRDILSTSSVIIDAPRRFGKTSVIKEFNRQEKTGNNYSILYFELEGTESIEDFCLALFKELISLYKYKNALDKLINLGSDFWNQLVSRI